MDCCRSYRGLPHRDADLIEATHDVASGEKTVSVEMPAMTRGPHHLACLASGGSRA